MIARPGQRAGLLAAALCLAGCVGGGPAPVAMFGLGEALEPARAAGGNLAAPEQGSALIADLAARRTVLPHGPLAEVSEAVIAASAGTAVAELRIARLQTEAQATNWLPKIGPTVSLGSLSDVVASLIVEQALFDNGRRKAERVFAAADVEVAAVSLAEDMNDRVLTGLRYYLDAERTREQAAVAERAVGHLREFNRIKGLRVGGELSDMGEQQILNQTLAEMQATLAGDQAAVLAALDSLNAMAARPLDGLRGLQPRGPASAEPLAVARARAEGARDVANARITRADLLPGAVLRGEVDDDGASGDLVFGGSMLDAGLGATLSALDAAQGLADRRTAEAADEANRASLTLTREIEALQLRQTDGAEVLRQSQGNLSMFTPQYEVGRRSLLDLAGKFESVARQEREQAGLRYDIALRQLRMAALRFQLVDRSRL